MKHYERPLLLDFLLDRGFERDTYPFLSEPEEFDYIYAWNNDVKLVINQVNPEIRIHFTGNIFDKWGNSTDFILRRIPENEKECLIFFTALIYIHEKQLYKRFDSMEYDLANFWRRARRILNKPVAVQS